MAYTTINKGSDYFNTKLYTGDETSSHAITGVGFQPDWTWIKNTFTTDGHHMYDVIRGATIRIRPDRTDAETTQANGLLSFDSDGFTVGDMAGVNDNTRTIASWNWLAGGTASSNSDGSITSNVSANITSGFSIVSYTANGVAGATIGHGLGAVPQVVITKDRDATSNWFMYHVGTDASAPEDKYMELESTDAVQDFPVWNDTAPTSSVFSIGTAAGNNTNGNDIIAYCFAEKKGFSKFGSYSGNGSTDGPFVYTGFKPAWFMIKNTSTTSNWTIFDNKRDGYNEITKSLDANVNSAEDTSTAYNDVDFCSNGIKIREDNGDLNGSGNTIIYMAFAENPLVTSTGIPATAR